MLVFTRKPGDGITIGGTTEVVIQHIGASRVKVGVHAPKDIRILRSELLDNRSMDGVRDASDGKGHAKDGTEPPRSSAGLPDAAPVGRPPANVSLPTASEVLGDLVVQMRLAASRGDLTSERALQMVGDAFTRHLSRVERVHGSPEVA